MTALWQKMIREIARPFARAKRVQESRKAAGRAVDQLQSKTQSTSPASRVDESSADIVCDWAVILSSAAITPRRRFSLPNETGKNTGKRWRPHAR
jgi:hypothetical protein